MRLASRKRLTRHPSISTPTSCHTAITRTRRHGSVERGQYELRSILPYDLRAFHFHVSGVFYIGDDPCGRRQRLYLGGLVPRGRAANGKLLQVVSRAAQARLQDCTLRRLPALNGCRRGASARMKAQRWTCELCGTIVFGTKHPKDCTKKECECRGIGFVPVAINLKGMMAGEEPKMELTYRRCDKGCPERPELILEFFS